MKSENDVLLRFNASTFWDIDLHKLEIQSHKSFIIRRVIEDGLWSDIALLFKIYTLHDITSTLAKSRSFTDGKAGAFAKQICNLDSHA